MLLIIYCHILLSTTYFLNMFLTFPTLLNINMSWLLPIFAKIDRRVLSSKCLFILITPYTNFNQQQSSELLLSRTGFLNIKPRNPSPICYVSLHPSIDGGISVTRKGKQNLVYPFLSQFIRSE